MEVRFRRTHDLVSKTRHVALPRPTHFLNGHAELTVAMDADGYVTINLTRAEILELILYLTPPRPR